MKLLLVIEDVCIGGQQTYTYNILKHLDYTKSSVYTATFLDGDFRYLFDEISEQVIIVGSGSADAKTIKRKPWSVFKAIFQLVWFARKEKVDIIITNGSITHLVGTIAAFLSRKKCVRLIGGDLNKNEKFFFVKHFNTVPLHKLTDLFFGWPSILKDHANKGVKESKLIDLCNGTGVDTIKFSPISKALVAEERKRLNINDEQLVIGWVGRIHQNMEIIHTLLMLDKFKELNFVNFKFLVVGDGPWLPEFKQKAMELNLDKHIIYLGWQAVDRVPLLLNVMDIVPLLDQDPMGGSIIREAMSCGRVIITTNGASKFQSTWVHHNQNGLLVEPANMYLDAAKLCVEIYQNPDYRSSIEIGARNYAKEKMDFSNLTKVFYENCTKLLN